MSDRVALSSGAAFWPAQGTWAPGTCSRASVVGIFSHGLQPFLPPDMHILAWGLDLVICKIQQYDGYHFQDQVIKDCESPRAHTLSLIEHTVILQSHPWKAHVARNWRLQQPSRNSFLHNYTSEPGRGSFPCWAFRQHFRGSLRENLTQRT